MKKCLILSFILAFPLSAMDSDYKFKLALIGGSGRSSLVNRFVNEKFSENSELTIGFDLASKNIIIENKICKLTIWFSSSQKRFRPFQPEALNNAHAVLIATDLTSPESPEEIFEWLNEAKNRALPNSSIILVGTKSDLAHDIKTNQEIKAYNLPYFETSAKKNINVTEVFTFAAQEAKNKLEGQKK